MSIEFVNDIGTVKAAAWDALWQHQTPSAYPFVKHAFLAALEQSQSVGADSGWLPRHLVAYDGAELVAAMPLYLKNHSYGEYVFDWAWADAYQRYGLNYYPKLLNAIPFTPAMGPRCALKTGTLSALELWQAVEDQAHKWQASSLHSLFPNDMALELEQAPDVSKREGCQFHWFNESYSDFEAFLQTFSSRKRKNIRKERRKAESFEIRVRHGSELNEDDWQQFYKLYHLTYLKRSGRPGYLGAEFFPLVGKQLPDQVILISAHLETGMVAAAVYFRDESTLYGRYWGSLAEFDGLHFECCYYQGIEYAIREGLARFDPGAQGEHKIQRGFQPVLTHSYHVLFQPDFVQPVRNFCEQEQQQNRLYLNDARNYLPFKQGWEPVAADVLTKRSQ